MRLEKIRIENFRSFKDETVEFDSYTCLVGPNGAGKSTVLTALNVFFRNNASTATNVLDLSSEDFHYGDVSKPVKITLTFKDLSKEAQDELQLYYRQGRLVVSAQATWSEVTKTAEVKQFGARNVMPDFAPYFKAVEDGAKAAELQKIYDGIRKKHSKLPTASTGPKREEALREFEEAHPELCKLLESPMQFFGFTKGANLLRKYVQWVYVPAVKDASTEQQEGTKCAMTDLLDRTVRSKVNFKEPIAALKKQVQVDYQKIVEAEKGALVDLENSMQERLKEWASPSAMLRLGWHYDESKSVEVREPLARATIGEDNFVGEVSRLGHGMQRSFLVAVLHELASVNSESSPTLLLGFEEPELYQHPPQAQHMSSVLESLADCQKANTQVIISTHSPYFVSSKGFESVRVVRKRHEDKCSLVASTTYQRVHDIIANALGEKPQLPSKTIASIEQIMQPSQRELYFSRVAVLVEGLEDVGFLSAHLVITDRWRDFRRLGCHFITTGGKNAMSRPLAIAKELCIHTYAIIDGDTKTPGNQKRDNNCILTLCDLSSADPMPKTPAYHQNCTVWHTSLANVVESEVGQKKWEQTANHVRQTMGFIGSSSKNKMFIACILDQLFQEDKFVSNAMTEVANRILAFAEQVPGLGKKTAETAVAPALFAAEAQPSTSG